MFNVYHHIKSPQLPPRPSSGQGAIMWEKRTVCGPLYAGCRFVLHFFTNRISLPSGHIPLSFWFSPSFQILAAKRCSVEQLLTSHWNKVSTTHHFSIQNCHLRNSIISLPSSNIIIMFNMILKPIIFQFQYGRNFFTRYDYEGCASAPCEQMMNNLETLVI